MCCLGVCVRVYVYVLSRCIVRLGEGVHVRIVYLYVWVRVYVCMLSTCMCCLGVCVV